MESSQSNTALKMSDPLKNLIPCDDSETPFVDAYSQVRPYFRANRSTETLEVDFRSIPVDPACSRQDS